MLTRMVEIVRIDERPKPLGMIGAAGGMFLHRPGSARNGERRSLSQHSDFATRPKMGFPVPLRRCNPLWMLGGEIIRRFHDGPALRSKSMKTVLLQLTDDECGHMPKALQVPGSQPKSRRQIASATDRFR
jgi:hypothetical protein